MKQSLCFILTLVVLVVLPGSGARSEQLPPVFGTRLSDQQLGHKLDGLFYGLQVETAKNAYKHHEHKEKLFNLLKKHNLFSTKTFNGFYEVLAADKALLHENYGEFKHSFNKAHEEFEKLAQQLGPEDAKLAREIWSERIEQMEEDFKKYYSYENKFIEVYAKLLEFVSDKAGTYFYRKETDEVVFYSIGDYDYFNQVNNGLQKINRLQINQVQKYYSQKTQARR